jgi:hypothetical protein
LGFKANEGRGLILFLTPVIINNINVAQYRLSDIVEQNKAGGGFLAEFEVFRPSPRFFDFYSGEVLFLRIF